jgi:hypothetical protein
MVHLGGKYCMLREKSRFLFVFVFRLKEEDRAVLLSGRLLSDGPNKAVVPSGN